MTWTFPNILTALRLLAAPMIAVIFLVLPRPFADILALTLFVCASLTDYLDGYLARKWNQVTKLGAMLDPIADKAMVVIALMVIVGFSSLSLALVLPAAIILFREVFVSGLREFLGDTAGTLKVTKLAKWKTASQMVAIAVLLAQGIFEHYFGMWSWGMDQETVALILSGGSEDVNGLRSVYSGAVWTSQAGLGLLWIAAVLTLVTGFDYFRKAAPFLKD
ncbi:CDP-diacylglycerol--glycerol-3-phosphate 3-phosphatidyltransferase [Cognatishimia activa]|uniref:CDP-diacylglycerol--glycerol-3-phosphate 3-phosphatidyltransferase n=1 Tax=Cognatishimia activa TaxID=1715691 RepID=A0A0P1IR54_9RHOB|nr:CDP-diacylglycerol--glycerol-3-phosphate 3-phosphatidyltransferase [Cognatishimia activa]CUJ05072.1 CDP-diacylglycerol--glycerol-3-phosphate 3-phosphatidyltransferase [Cognatishimia activa]CUK26053.1 CDP-diacylglycerol--glycerol-3-phosphate 3-phosphatidyltransferase [Cognatishimia activa]